MSLSVLMPSGAWPSGGRAATRTSMRVGSAGWLASLIWRNQPNRENRRRGAPVSGAARGASKRASRPACCAGALTRARACWSSGRSVTMPAAIAVDLWRPCATSASPRVLPGPRTPRCFSLPSTSVISSTLPAMMVKARVAGSPSRKMMSLSRNCCFLLFTDLGLFAKRYPPVRRLSNPIGADGGAGRLPPRPLNRKKVYPCLRPICFLIAAECYGYDRRRGTPKSASCERVRGYFV